MAQCHVGGTQRAATGWYLGIGTGMAVTGSGHLSPAGKDVMLM